MSTNYIAPIWRMPRNANKDKLSNYSIHFNTSSTNYIDLGSPSVLDFQTGEMTLSCWINSETVSSLKPILGNSNSALTSYQYLLDVNRTAGKISFLTSGVPTLTSSLTISANTWYHICITKSGTTSNWVYTMYINGSSSDGATASTTTNPPATQTTAIGRYGAAGGYYFQGEISQVCFFDYALTDGTGGTTNQIGYLYNLNNPMISGTVNLTAPVAYYPLGDNSNPNAPGSFPNISTGTDSVFAFVTADALRITDSAIVPERFQNIGNENSYSISFWVKTTYSGTGASAWYSSHTFTEIRTQTSSGTHVPFSIGLRDGDVWFGRTPNHTVSDQAFQSASRIDDGNWHHVVCTVNVNTLKYYIDGDLDDTKTFTAAIGDCSVGDGTVFPTQNFQIGARTQNGGAMDGFANGDELTNFQFWDTELLAADVNTLYNNGQPLMTGTQPKESNLIGWYKMNQSANWEADTASNWQIPDAVSSYPQSFDFGDANAGGQYIDAPTDIGGFTKCSTSVWLNPSSVSAKSTIFATNTNTNFNSYFWTGSIIYVTVDNAYGYLGAINNYIDANKWNHLSIVYDGTFTDSDAATQNAGRLKMYINGSYISFQGFGGTIPSSIPVSGSENIRIGTYTPTLYEFGGELSNFTIYDTNLSSSQVTELYNNGSPLTTAIATDNLKAWYKLNNNEIFNGTNWEVENQKYPAGFDSALSFPAADDYISIGSTTLGINTAIAISAWVKTSVNTGYGAIINEDDAGTKRNWNLLRKNDDIFFTIYHDGTGSSKTNITTSTINVSDNKWHHVVGTWDGTTNADSMKVYFDGVEVGQATPSSTGINTEAAAPWIGNSTTIVGNNSWTGEISNIAIYNKNLDSTAITALYNNGTPETSISSSPVSWWKLDNTTTGIQDSVGSNDGTNNGATKVNTFVSTEAATSSGMTGQNLVNNNVSVLNAQSQSMATTSLVQSNLTRTQPYSNYSFNFDGATNDYINSTDDDIFSFGDSVNDSPFSISAWVKTTNGSGKGIISKWGNTGTSGYEWLFWLVGPNKVRLNLLDGSNTVYQTAQGNTSVNTGEWVHVAATYDGRGGTGSTGNTANQGIKIYVNGVEDTPYSYLNNGAYTAMHNTSRIVQLGAYNNLGQFDGQISNTAIFDIELTNQEILKIYNNGITQDLQTVSSFSNNIVAWWPMDQRSSYFDGTNWVVRELENAQDGTGVNTSNVEDMVGNAPGSDANGTGTNLTIADLEGDMSNSNKNAHSINMGDYADGVTNPADSGRSTNIPSV